MADFDLLGDGLRKVLLAGIGALATGYEKSSELVDELVKKGEITVEQGKALNTELKRKVSETVDDAKKAAADGILAIGDRSQLTAAVARLHSSIANPFFGVGVQSDLMNSDINALYASQPDQIGRAHV